MTTLAALGARTTTLEYAVFEQFPHTVEAMTHPLTQANALAVENGEAIAGLRIDMAALQVSIHREMTDFKATLDLQGDSLRNALAVATAEYRTSLTGVREAMSLRFQKVDGQFNGVNDDIANLQADVTGLKQDVGTLKGDVTAFKGEVSQRFGTVDQRFDALDAKIDTLIAEIRSSKN